MPMNRSPRPSRRASALCLLPLVVLAVALPRLVALERGAEDGPAPETFRDPPRRFRPLQIVHGLDSLGPGEEEAARRLRELEAPIVPYDDDFARDDGVKRNFWRAVNLDGEPRPAAPGTKEEFPLGGVPDLERLFFLVVSHADSGNRSAPPNVVELEPSYSITRGRSRPARGPSRSARRR